MKPSRFPLTQKLHVPTNLPSGTKVTYINDNCQHEYTTTRSEPWQIGGGVWVVSLTGKSGGYDLARIRLQEQP
jgi:hypothetical protein